MNNQAKEPLTAKHFILGIQHLFAMFGATVLVPALTGLNPALALLGAGVGTFLFHFITKRKVPVFLGSSFAYVAAIQIVMDNDPTNIPKVQGGIIVAGIVYILLSVLVYFVGVERIRNLLPPVVTGPVIIVIGLTLSPTAITSASTCWPLALVVVAVIIIFMCFTKGFFKLVPVLFGLMAGYLLALIFDLTGTTSFFLADNAAHFIDFSIIENADWITNFFGLWTAPQFDIAAISTIAPLALVTFMEHIGDITTNGAVVGQDFFKDPGLHRTLLGDGIATSFAGLLGAPANTTYGENTGVLAVTKMYDPRVIRLAAVYAIILALFGKFGAVLQTIPTAVMGGVSLILFGMISSVGLRTMSEAKLDFSNSRNLIIVALILVVGLGLSSASLDWLFNLFGASNSPFANLSFSGLFIATLTGIILNKVLPKDV
ncbi:MAG: uracil-xanthine permease [Clostridiales bacterium]|nr:uracil-xanthine permease [Clostridiales bacterium]